MFVFRIRTSLYTLFYYTPNLLFWNKIKTLLGETRLKCSHISDCPLLATGCIVPTTNNNYSLALEILNCAFSPTLSTCRLQLDNPRMRAPFRACLKHFLNQLRGCAWNNAFDVTHHVIVTERMKLQYKLCFRLVHFFNTSSEADVSRVTSLASSKEKTEPQCWDQCWRQ